MRSVIGLRFDSMEHLIRIGRYVTVCVSVLIRPGVSRTTHTAVKEKTEKKDTMGGDSSSYVICGTAFTTELSIW